MSVTAITAATQPQPVQAPTTRRAGCRPGGCAGLCTEAGLALAYQTYGRRLRGRAYGVLGDAGLAEEAVQETFVRAWRACATFDPDAGPMLTWLGVITRNIAIDLLKARTRRPSLLRSVPVEVASPAARPSEVDLVLLRAELRDALAGINAEHLAAVVETIVRDRPYDDVAAELGVPVGTIKSRVHYALRRLRTLMQDAEQAA